MIVWIERALIVAIHERQIAEHGGGSGVRDQGLLDSALARPQQAHAYGDPPPDLVNLAATLAYGLARNHPFVDGNKRTAYVACRTFLRLNGTDIVATLEDKYATMLALAEGRLTAEEFADWLRPRCEALPSDDSVQERKASYRTARRAAERSPKAAAKRAASTAT